MKNEINRAQGAKKESNEALLERVIKDLDTWQDGCRKKRVALLVVQDENGKTCIECFANNRGKNPFLRFLGRMIGIVANRDGLFEAVMLVARLACKMRNRKAKNGVPVV